MKFQGDLLLTDPMYLIPKHKESDWELVLSEGAEKAALYLLGITDYLSFAVGEDGRRIVVNNAGHRIGEFCWDSAFVCVCDLNQVLLYNPNFLTLNKNYLNSFCIIRNFNGEIKVIVDEEGTPNIVGSGDNGFRTI
jgi:hypothetical protein